MYLALPAYCNDVEIRGIEICIRVFIHYVSMVRTVVSIVLVELCL